MNNSDLALHTKMKKAVTPVRDFVGSLFFTVSYIFQTKNGRRESDKLCKQKHCNIS